MPRQLRFSNVPSPYRQVPLHGRAAPFSVQPRTTGLRWRSVAAAAASSSIPCAAGSPPGRRGAAVWWEAKRCRETGAVPSRCSGADALLMVPSMDHQPNRRPAGRNTPDAFATAGESGQV